MSTLPELNAHSRRAHSEALREIQVELCKTGSPDKDGIRRLAERLRMPTAAVRSSISYYVDLAEPNGAVRLCHGTSCQLAGAGELHERMAREAPCRTVFCLGYCDRSPALLRPDDGMVVECRESTIDAILAVESAPPPPSVRSAVAEPIVMRNVIRGDFSNIEKARDAGVYGALEGALRGEPGVLLETLTRSGHRGRGGAGFPAAAKWRACREAAGELKYVVANGDEGDPGSFIDRLLMELDPHSVLEGMALSAFAVGAREGVVFIRSEYPEAIRRMTQAVADAREAGVLGPSVLGSDFAFDVRVFPGKGSYVCGEETAMLNAIEGRRGEVRLRPPYPVQSGLWGRPTVVNNVETLVNVPWIVERGAEAYALLGTNACSGTKAICLNHGFERPGVVEVEFGTSLREVIEREGGGGRGGAEIEAVLLGGPMGSVVEPERWDAPICYSAMAERGLVLGHGGLVAVHAGTDWQGLLRHWLRFMAHESCGKCAPCRIGSKRALELANEPTKGGAGWRELERWLDVIADTSLCAFGQLMPRPMRQIVERFGDGMLEKGDRS